MSKRQKLDEALIGTGFPYRKLDQLEEYLAIFRSVTERAGGIRRPGAAALDLAYVACGRADAYFEAGVKPWDIAAGVLLVREAGGKVSDFRGRATGPMDGRGTAGRGLIAGNVKIADVLQKRIVETGYAAAFD